MKLFSPAAERNKAPFAQVLRSLLPERGRVLEIASGSGQHAAFMARTFPHLSWQPSERDDRELASIHAYREEAGQANLLPPVRLDVLDTPWDAGPANALVCMNMIHISPWETTAALFRGAGRLLDDDEPCCLYGPFRRLNGATAPSNEAFDTSLRARDPAWGLRVLEDVATVAEAAGFRLQDIHPMPANNLVVTFRRVAYNVTLPPI